MTIFGNELNTHPTGQSMPTAAIDASGRHWRRRASGSEADSDAAASACLVQALGCPRAIAELLVGHGIRGTAEAEAFLNPKLEELLGPAADPMRMRGMPEAVVRILAAVEAGEPILIYGDYDVDGTTATVLLKTAIERIGLAMQPPRPALVTYHVPHRIREGYGMQNNVLGLAAREGIRLVISVDTGIRAFAAADEARALGLDLIVTDHHLPDDLRIPEALAVINPAQANCEYPSKHLCGAAVAFKLAQALLSVAAERTADPAKFAERTDQVLLPSFLKLVAIATIADSVPLTGENRTIAALGLAALANPVQPGLRALMQVAKIPLDRAPTATEVGFRIAPRINAAGRMDVAGDVVELFLTRDPARAQQLAEKLDSLNQDRRDTEAKALEAIELELLTLIDGDGSYPAECILLDNETWHRGVLGILASRVVERTGRPAIVMTHADGQVHGSGRSIDGFHLLDAIIAAEECESGCALFNRFGGHAHAVGFSLPSERLGELRARMKAHAAEFLKASSLVPVLEYDAEIELNEITPELQRWITRCAPFGMGNPEPVFFARGARLAAPVRRIKDKHICLRVHGGEGGGATLSALGWSRPTTDWSRRCEELKLGEGSQADLLFRLKLNSSEQYGGLELELCDVRLADPVA
jgi:single-stranded-DNA-specific exonuclease